ncbi:TPA: 30S ribosomal protein S4 [Candidatus Galligastranaerophilus intestinavium]|uniref:Small ribosomal subunit protein uS4 n=1 Tax=Candidatus Galligastranaerophilus intestinavium TaxID=2840836 RepID=A0A9D1JXH2_9BACT|nr:30S ribosomal protein S4 [Candidatus Galligastranaerophilus intestinavium]
MARYTGPTNKLYRNFGVKDLSNRKLTSSMRQNSSGQHGAMRKKASDYALQLKEKQKIRLTYLVSEKQFAKYYETASRKTGVTGTIMLQMLESRLDNVIFRAGFAVTRRQARQIVNHGHVLVNGKKVDIPSYLLKAGDEITVKSNSQNYIKNVQESIDMALSFAWLNVDKAAQKIIFDRVPQREEMDPEFKEQLVIEYYSK